METFVIKDRAEFGALLNSLDLKGLAIEVGVWRGDFSKLLLDTWHGQKLTLVDPWRVLDDYTDYLNGTDRNIDYDICCQKLACHAGRWDTLRFLSEEAASYCKDDLFDFVYIDANHEYEYISRDLRLWYPKVRSGGIFAGHDYYSTVTWPGVQKAVNEFAPIKIETTFEVGGSWYWRKP